MHSFDHNPNLRWVFVRVSIPGNRTASGVYSYYQQCLGDDRNVSQTSPTNWLAAWDGILGQISDLLDVPRESIDVLAFEPLVTDH